MVGTRQGIALSGDKENDNLDQLLRLRGEDDKGIFSWPQRVREKRNEILQIMAHQILRDISSNIHESPFFALLADETIDSSNLEQLVVCIRWNDKALHAEEELTKLVKLSPKREAHLT